MLTCNAATLTLLLTQHTFHSKAKAEPASRAVQWSIRFLLFKLMFMSGVVKITVRCAIYNTPFICYISGVEFYLYSRRADCVEACL